MAKRSILRSLPAAQLALAFIGILPAHAEAVELGVRVDPGAALPITPPQSDRFGIGGGGALKLHLGFAGVFDIQLGGHALVLPATDQAPSPDPATLYGVGAGFRLKRPHASGIASPWVDAEALYVRTGALDRFAFAVAVGLNFGLGAARRVWLGPYVRYLEIVQGERAGFDNRDARLLIFGVELEVAGAARPGPGTPADLDGDGIPDPYDSCREVPEDKDGYQDQDGCPEPDNDGDGILDAQDRCPNEAEDRDRFQDADGCPDPDNDGDGIPDVVDRCPGQAEDRDGFEDADGCPEPDNDKDELLDADDSCPNAFGPRETRGCPDVDLDGTPDAQDPCPDVPGRPENRGCPVYKSIKVTRDKIELSQRIFFAFNKTKILPRSFPLLDEVAQALKDEKSIKVRIEGHTDELGNTRRNLALSEGRAGAVAGYLVKHGIAAERLQPQGYGATLPIDTNRTIAGREHNRRVEFVILNNEGSGK